MRYRYLLAGISIADGLTYALSGVRGGHHVLGVEHLLSELRNGNSSVRSGTSSSQGSETDHEEMESREGNHVDGQLSEIRVELTGESKTGGDTGHDDRDEVVKIAVGRGGELEGPEANVVEGLVVDTEGSVRVLNKLVDGEGSVVRLDDGVGDLELASGWRMKTCTDLGGWHNGESAHHSVRVLFSDL